MKHKEQKSTFITCQPTRVGPYHNKSNKSLARQKIILTPDRNLKKRHVNIVLSKQRKNKSVDAQRNTTRPSPLHATTRIKNEATQRSFRVQPKLVPAWPTSKHQNSFTVK